MTDAIIKAIQERPLSFIVVGMVVVVVGCIRLGVGQEPKRKHLTKLRAYLAQTKIKTKFRQYQQRN